MCGALIEQVLLQPQHRRHEVVGQRRPADPPAGHAPVLGEAVDHHGAVAVRAGGAGRPVPVQPVIDLVADQAHAVGVAEPRQRRQLVRVQRGAGRVARARHDQPVRQALRRVGHRLQQGDARLVARVRPRLDHHRAHTQRMQNVVVGRVVRAGHGDAVAGIERGQERQQEPARRPGGDHDPRRRHRHAVGRAAMRRDPLAQRRKPERLGVAERQATGQRALRRRHRGRRRPGGGLADLQPDHARVACPAHPLALVGPGHHLHRQERRQGGAGALLQPGSRVLRLTHCVWRGRRRAGRRWRCSARGRRGRSGRRSR